MDSDLRRDCHLCLEIFHMYVWHVCIWSVSASKSTRTIFRSWGIPSFFKIWKTTAWTRTLLKRSWLLCRRCQSGELTYVWALDEVTIRWAELFLALQEVPIRWAELFLTLRGGANQVSHELFLALHQVPWAGEVIYFWLCRRCQSGEMS